MYLKQPSHTHSAFAGPDCESRRVARGASASSACRADALSVLEYTPPGLGKLASRGVWVGVPGEKVWPSDLTRRCVGSDVVPVSVMDAHSSSSKG